MEAEGIVKLRSLYASRRRVPGADLREREERESRAPALRWPECGDTGGISCSRSMRTRGGRWLVEKVREKAGTAQPRACLRRQREVAGERKGKVREWICLVEAKWVAQGLGRWRSGEEDRPVAGIGGERESSGLCLVWRKGEELAGYL
uniref:Uncharacterized protein n=1 Tax=Oryza meridionalis TaxID=40149 RepID=A0A0E0CIR9_9ORYZ